MKNLPPLKPLVSFRAAAKHRSLTKAAYELNLTHGAVSKAVKQLEDFFGFELFHRQNRGLHLTEKGKLLVSHVDIALSELEKACEAVRTPETKRRLSVSCEPTLAMRWLMPRLDEFYQANPNIDIHLSTEGGPIDLSAEGVHLAIRRSDFTWPPHYVSTSLGNESIGPVCSPTYWDINQNKPKQLIHTRTRPEAWTDWKQLSDATTDTDSEKYFNHFCYTLQAAVGGLGIAIGPDLLVQEDLKRGLLIAPYGFKKTPFEYVVLSLQNPQDNDDMNAFISWLKKEFESPVMTSS